MIASSWESKARILDLDARLRILESALDITQRPPLTLEDLNKILPIDGHKTKE